MDAELDRIFDFNSTGPPELALAFRPSQDSNGLVTKLEAAAGAGDLMAVQSLWEELQLHPSAWYWTKDTGALFAAVKNQCRSVICFLLGQGMRPTNREARPVAQHRDLATLELFLRHGWDINEAAGASNPSIL